MSSYIILIVNTEFLFSKQYQDFGIKNLLYTFRLQY